MAKYELISKAETYTTKEGETRNVTGFYLRNEKGNLLKINPVFKLDFFRLKDWAEEESGEEE